MPFLGLVAASASLPLPPPACSFPGTSAGFSTHPVGTTGTRIMRLFGRACGAEETWSTHELWGSRRPRYEAGIRSVQALGLPRLGHTVSCLALQPRQPFFPPLQGLCPPLRGLPPFCWLCVALVWLDGQNLACFDLMFTFIFSCFGSFKPFDASFDSSQAAVDPRGVCDLFLLVCRVRSCPQGDSRSRRCPSVRSSSPRRLCRPFCMQATAFHLRLPLL